MKVVILLFYFVVSIVSGRKNHLLYLMFPLALMQGPGAFIQQDIISIGGLMPLNANTNAFNDTIFILLSLIAATAKTDYRLPSRFFGSGLFVIYLVFLIGILILSILINAGISDAFLVGRFFLFIPLYYFIWIRILSAATKEDFVQFLTVVCIINIISSILYILNSGHFIEIFPRESIYVEVSLGTKYFYRDFATIPILASFIFPLCILIFIRNEYVIPKYIVITNLVLMPVVILYTFTRGWFLSLAIITFLALISSLILSHISTLRKLLFPGLIAIILVVSFQILDIFFPSELEYFTNRFVSVQYEGINEGNVRIRQEYTTVAYQILEKEKRELFGIGFTKEFYQAMGEVGAWSADSMWPTHILHTGIIGVVFISGIMIFFIGNSWIQFLRTQSIWHQLCFVLFSSLFALSFSSTAINGNSLVMLSFGLFTVESLDYWKKTSNDKTQISFLLTDR